MWYNARIFDFVIVQYWIKHLVSQKNNLKTKMIDKKPSSYKKCWQGRKRITDFGRYPYPSIVAKKKVFLIPMDCENRGKTLATKSLKWKFE